ncbi:MAG: 2-amino-4-hydroxy-6-hydroxymethyldihydropteridine diphosphokinase [Terracidiphilus sp.]
MHIAYIGLGGNLPSPAGPPEAILAAAVARLSPLGRVAARSSLYSTAPVGFAEQPRFVNAVAALQTELAPRALLCALMAIEQECGRDRAASVPNGPRTLDMDILLFDDFVIGEADLEIPHPRLAERAFVLVPLGEIAADVCDPRSGMSIGDLLRGLSSSLDDAAHAVVRTQSDLWDACAGRA